MDGLEPAAHLSTDSQRLFADVVEEYTLESHSTATLVAALEARDRMIQARTAIEADGLMVKSRLGELKVNPLVAVERDSRIAFYRGLRELALSPTEVESRPPRAAVH